MGEKKEQLSVICIKVVDKEKKRHQITERGNVHDEKCRGPRTEAWGTSQEKVCKEEVVNTFNTKGAR